MHDLDEREAKRQGAPLRNDQAIAWPNDLMFCYSFSATSDTTTTPVGRRQKRIGTYIRADEVRSAPSSLCPSIDATNGKWAGR
jgi:hypothetical protein